MDATRTHATTPDTFAGARATALDRMHARLYRAGTPGQDIVARVEI